MNERLVNNSLFPNKINRCEMIVKIDDAFGRNMEFENL